MLHFHLNMQFEDMIRCGYFKVSKVLRSSKLSFDVDNLNFWGLATVLATFSKIWKILFKSSGYPEVVNKTILVLLNI
jgi:hypothetical protein